MSSKFIYLKSRGCSINPDAITHIVFGKPNVMLHLGNDAIEVSGPDADMLREGFAEPLPAEPPAAKPGDKPPAHEPTPKAK